MTGNFDWDLLDRKDKLKKRVTSVSIFIAAYEHLKNGIIEQGRAFFVYGDKLNRDYGKQVLRRHKKPDISTLLWIQENEGISTEKIERYQKLTKFRNELVHRYINAITNMKFDLIEVFLSLSEVMKLLQEINTWFYLQSPEYAIMRAESPEYIYEEEIAEVGSSIIFKKILQQVLDIDVP